MRIIFAIFAIWMLTGCVQKQYSFNKVDTTSTINKDLEIELTPTGKSYIAGYSAFILNIKNNTNRDMELDWNKTNFIKDGNTSGTFMFEGVVYKDRNAPKANDIIFANSNFSKTIYPNNFVTFDSYGWAHTGTGLGTQGAYLSIVDGKDTIKQKVLINISGK